MRASQTTTPRSAPRGHDAGRRRRRAGLSWLALGLALLLALTLGAAPSQHARAVLTRASDAVAVAGAGAPHHGHAAAGGAHDQRLLAPACLACVLMAAPGLPAGPCVAAGRAAPAEAAFLPRSAVPARPGAAWSAPRARAPPFRLTA